MGRPGKTYAVVALALLTCAALPKAAQAQRAVGRCPTVISVPVQQYYLPVSLEPAATAVAPQPTVVVGGYQPTVVIVIPQAEPQPSPFGPRHDEQGRIVGISTPQFLGSPSPGFFNSQFILDEDGRIKQIMTPQALPPLCGPISRPLTWGRPCGATSFFETSSFGGTFGGGLRLHIFGE
jgi:hypothetical protein